MDNGFTLDLNKCNFEAKATRCLGFIVEVVMGICMDPEKMSVIAHKKTPTTVKAICSFLGFANYYQLFIGGFSNIAKPLFDLTR